MTDLERDLRDMMQRTADELQYSPVATPGLVRRARFHRARTLVLAGAAILALVLGGSAVTRSLVDDQAIPPVGPPEGIFAKVGGWITYGAEDGIWAVDPDQPSDRIRLSSMQGAPSMSPDHAVPRAWSPDGSRLLLVRVRDARSPTQRTLDLSVLHADGSETTLTEVRAGEWPDIWPDITGGSFTPDGSKVIYAESSHSERSGIYMVDAEGGVPEHLLAPGRRLGRRSLQMAILHPTLSSDGSRIAYFEGMGDHSNSLWVMDADGSDKVQILGPQYGHVFNLQWSPDGTRLAFDFRGEPGGTNVVNADGSDLFLAIPNGWDPHWSPDGSRISYVVGLDSDPDNDSLRVAAPDGSQVTDLGVGGSGPWNPSIP